MKKMVLRIMLMMLGAVHAGAEPGSTDLGAIWFIGDSITQSNADGDSSGSPRKSLYDLLTAAGYSFTYTGHHAKNVDGLPTSGTDVLDNLYHYHSGISASMIGDDFGTRVGMTENMLTHWTTGRTALVKPNIILILLGTNDIGQEYDVANAPARLKALVESIYDLPDVGTPSIYVANIPPSIGRSETQTANVIAFNAEVPGVVSDLKSEGKDVRFVDLYTPLNDDYGNVMRSDNLHPNAAGNEVMAQAWFDAITIPEVIDEWPGTLSDFHGYDLYTFTTNGLDCKVAVPDVVAEGKPWIWRARFWDHQSGPDVALLGEGYHVAYVNVAGLFGSPTAVARFDAFYDFLTQEYGFDTRTVLEGMSRGGLAIYNWAAQNPDKVHCVYADAPVCDFKSWPAGFGTGSGSAGNWTACKAAYGFASDAEAIAYGGNPVDNMLPLAEAGIPLLHVVGDDDTTVPVAENTALVESSYNTLGGWINVIHKPGVGHTHGLADPTPIIEFILNSMNEIHNLEATAVTDSSATLNGLLSLTETNVEVQVHWGLTDGGANAGGWDQSASLGSWTTGDPNRVSYDIAALTQNSTYYYSFSASNENGMVWDDSLSVQVSSVVVAGVFSTTDADYGSFASSTDLINAGSATLASGPVYSTTPSFGPAANNDGTVGAAAASGDITFWADAVAGNTYTITYTLDTSANVFGYEITSLQTIHGWKNNSGNQKNQNYTVEVSTVGDAGFVNIATVAYLPFSSADTAGSSKVTVTDIDTGILASGVDQIRFTYTVPDSGGIQPGPTIREIDVFGTAIEVPADSIFVDGVFSSTDADYGSFASASDLVNAGSAALASGPTYSASPKFGPAANNDGSVGTASASGDITFWISASAGNTYSITYALDTTANTLGYDITSLQTIHGWKNNSGNQKNQNYTVEVSTVGSSGFTNMATVAYLPFSSEGTEGSSKVNVTAADGILATGVDAIRFIYTVPVSGGTQPSPTIREIDVFGVPTQEVTVEVPVFSSGVSISNGIFHTQFTGSIGAQYQVEYSDDLTTNAWRVVSTIGSLATSPMDVEMPATNTAGFYRVIGLP